MTVEMKTEQTEIETIETFEGYKVDDTYIHVTNKGISINAMHLMAVRVGKSTPEATFDWYDSTNTKASDVSKTLNISYNVIRDMRTSGSWITAFDRFKELNPDLTTKELQLLAAQGTRGGGRSNAAAAALGQAIIAAVDMPVPEGEILEAAIVGFWEAANDARLAELSEAAVTFLKETIGIENPTPEQIKSTASMMDGGAA